MVFSGTWVGRVKGSQSPFQVFVQWVQSPFQVFLNPSGNGSLKVKHATVLSISKLGYQLIVCALLEVILEANKCE